MATIDALLAAAREHAMSSAEKEAQRRSFAFGNVSLSNAQVTREVVDKAARSLKGE